MGRGGKRKGAGRPKGTGKFGEPTKAVRLPISLIDQTLQFVKNKAFVFPCHSQSESATTLLSDSKRVKRCSLLDSLNTTYASTTLVSVEEDAMVADGILPGDLLVVDYEVEPQNDDVVVAVVDGKTVVRWFVERPRGFELKVGSGKAPGYKFGSLDEVPFCGVVKKVVRDYYSQ